MLFNCYQGVAEILDLLLEHKCVDPLERDPSACHMTLAHLVRGPCMQALGQGCALPCCTARLDTCVGGIVTRVRASLLRFLHGQAAADGAHEALRVLHKHGVLARLLQQPGDAGGTWFPPGGVRVPPAGSNSVRRRLGVFRCAPLPSSSSPRLRQQQCAGSRAQVDSIAFPPGGL